MDKRIGGILMVLAAFAPGVGSGPDGRPLPGVEDTLLRAETRTAQPAPALRTGRIDPQTGVPCRRSATDANERGSGAGHPKGRRSGCNLRLVKRRPADPLIWL